MRGTNRSSVAVRHRGLLTLAALVVAILAVVVTLGSTTLAFAQKDRTPRRSLPPEEFDSQTEEVFAGDASDRLRGPRPTSEPAVANSPTKADVTAPDAAGKFAWSTLISGDTLIDEIKSHRAELTRSVRNVRAFRAGGNRDARLRLSVIAAMFGVAAEYDGSVRWQKQSKAARDAFASAGRNAKAADDNTFKESRSRSEDLDELIRGGSVGFAEADKPLTWDEIAERPPLMQRLEVALEKRLRPWTANKREFSRNKQQAVHETEVIAALAEIIQREAYELVDDDEYLEYCRQLGRHAVAARVAAHEENFDVLEREIGEISKSCSACHEDFR